MQVEIVFALPESQVLEMVVVPDGATVGDVIRRSGLARRFPEIDDLQAGIWGKPVERVQPVSDGDRVELYRVLEMDPREARRLKAGL